MANRKKVNTLDLIQQMTRKNRETLDAVGIIKQERSPQAGITDPKQHSGPKSVRKESVNTVPSKKKPGKLDNGTGPDPAALKQLNVILDTESFSDKKEIFTWSVSGDCLSKYEKMATAISYKMGIKSSRNQLMRKVLEDFIHGKYDKIIREIEQK